MFPRILSDQILAQFDSPDLVFLLGTRQTGKTTLAHLLAKDSSYSKDETWYFSDSLAGRKRVYLVEPLDFAQDITRSLYFYRTQSKSEIDFMLVKDANYHLIEVKSGKHQHIPRAMMEFEKKYAEKLSIVSKRVINQSVYLQKASVEFLPAYLL